MDSDDPERAQAEMEYYRDALQCFVPSCKKYRRDFPNSLYLSIPKSLQGTWCQALDRNCPKRNLYVCEEHINVEEDCYKRKSGKLHLKKTANLILTKTYDENEMLIDDGNLTQGASRDTPATSVQFLQQGSAKKSKIHSLTQTEMQCSNKTVLVKPTVKSVGCSANFKAIHVAEKIMPSQSSSFSSTTASHSPSSPTPSLYELSSPSSSSTARHIITDAKDMSGRTHILKLIEEHPKMYVGVPEPFFWFIDFLSNECNLRLLHVIIALFKLKQNDTILRMSHHFQLSSVTIQEVLRTSLPKLATFLQMYIYLPDSLTIKKALPPVFKVSRKVWLKAIKPENPKASTILICQLHFADNDITLNHKRRRLIHGAVPTRNLPRSDDQPAPAVVEEELQLEEIKTEPDDGVIVDLFTEEDTVVQNTQKRTLHTEESSDFSEAPVKRERLDDTYEGEEASEMQPKAIYDTSFPRPIQGQLQMPTLPNEKWLGRTNTDVPVTELDLFIKLSKVYLSPEVAKFVEVQALLKSELKVAFQSNKYTQDMLFFALKLYHKYPQTYKIMQESFCLPSMLKIRQLCRNLSWELNDSWMKVLRARFEGASASELECVVCVAKVKLALGLSYDPVRDRMTGLDEMNGGQRPRTARYAIVVYARGIISRWRQPLSYALLPASSRPEELWSWLENLISKLFDVGLNPRAVVSDIDDEYNPLIRPMPPSKTYFQLKNKQIYCFYDCTQLMVKLRDCFKMNNVYFKGMRAEWDVIEELFEYDSSRRYKLDAGLTAEHVNPVGSAARQTKLAIETMSSKVASALAAAVDIRVLDDSAHGTVQFITAFSTLYNILHNKELPVLQKGISPEMKFLHEMLINFEKISFMDKVSQWSFTGPEVISAFNKNVLAVMALQERIRRAGYTSLPMRAFNNDPLHQLYNRVRSLNGKKDPTGRQFIDGFRRSFVFNIMESFSKEGKLNGFLETASGIKNIRMEVDAPVFKGLVKASHLAPLKHLAMGTHILLAQCVRLKPCCELGLQLSKKPPAVFIEYMSNMESKFKLHFAPEKLGEGVMASILASLDEYQFPAPCRCFPVLFLKTLYLRFRISNLVEYNNAKFRRGISRDFTMNIKINSY